MTGSLDLTPFFGAPVIDFTVPNRDPWPWDEVFEYAPTDELGNLVLPEDQLYDGYDKGLAAWFSSWLRIWDLAGGVLTRTSRKVPIVFASPDRAFAEAAKKLCPDKSIKFDTPGVVKGVPLPFASLEQTGDVAFDRSRYQHRRVRYGGLSYDNREILQYKYPCPVILNYALSIWAKTRAELSRYLTDFARRFEGDNVCFNLVHGGGLGVKTVRLRWESVQQASELEPGTGNRVLRWVFPISIKGWLPYEPYSVRSILRADVEQAITDDAEEPDIIISDGVVTVVDVRDVVPMGTDIERTRPFDGPWPEDK